MIAISSWIFFQVVLMIVFRFPELLRSIFNSGHHFRVSAVRFLELGAEFTSGRVEFSDRALSEFLLLGVVEEDDRAILRALVVALAIQRRGIVKAEEEVEQFVV